MLQKFITTPEFKAIEHMLMVAVYWGLSAFLTELITLLGNDKTTAVFITNHSWALILMMLVNMLLAGGKKYVDNKKVSSVNSATATNKQSTY